MDHGPGATSHMVSNPGIISLPSKPPPFSHITVSNGVTLPVVSTGHTTLPTSTRTFALNNVLVVSDIKNLLSTRKFSTDNSCSVEFDPLGFSIKDL